MAIAIAASVTVSIAAETMGVFNSIPLEKREVKSTLRGSISEYAGTNSTSSKVNPSAVTLSSINDIVNDFELKYWDEITKNPRRKSVFRLFLKKNDQVLNGLSV